MTPRELILARIEAGIPFLDLGRDHQGVDCWGLAVLIYREDLGIALPHLDTCYAHTRAMDEMAETIRHECVRWVEVERGDERPYDIILLREAGIPVHVGIITRAGEYVSAERDAGVCLGRYPRPMRPNFVFGIYRHPALI